MNCANIVLYLTLLSGAVQPAPDSPHHMKAKDMAAKYGYPKPEIRNSSMVIKSSYSSLTLNADSRKISFNDTLLWLSYPVTVSGKSWLIHNTDLQTVIKPLLLSTEVLADERPRVVLLDPGHGGKNLGALGSRRKPEKTLVLDISERVMALLKAQGVDTRLTRDGDSYLKLNERVTRTAALNADVLISIHLNHAQNSKAEGIETYVTTPPGAPSTSGSTPESKVYRGNGHDRQNMALAYQVHSGMIKETSAPDRGIKHARFTVIRDAPCPAILLECGFLSNPSEEEKLTAPAYRQKLAQGIAKGVINYISRCAK